jgi:hypothetical protein
LVRTLSDRPADATPPTLVRANVTSLAVSVRVPTRPNGVVVSYAVLSGSWLLASGTEPGTYLLDGLLPFTSYPLLLEVCTVVGCARSAVVRFSTLQGVPAGIPAPSLSATGATQVCYRGEEKKTRKTSRTVG